MVEDNRIALVFYFDDDQDPFGDVHKDEAQRLWQLLRSNGLDTSPPVIKMPSPAAGGGWVTEFLIPFGKDAAEIIGAVSPIILFWLKQKKDHQIRLKLGDMQVMANSKEEAEEELKKLVAMQKEMNGEPTETPK